MELDELKKSWHALNEQLEKEPVADEKRIEELIARYKSKTRKSLGHLALTQRFSIGIGIVALLILPLTWLCLPALGLDERFQSKVIAFLLFITASLIAGIWWDRKTYRQSKAIRIDEMSVAEVSRRITAFRQWTKYEIIALSAWVILFNILNYWVMDYHLLSAGKQQAIIAILVAFNVILIYLFYKHFVYKHLNNIKKNIEELKDICTE